MSQARGGVLSILTGYCPKCYQTHHQDYAYCDGRRAEPTFWKVDKEDEKIFRDAAREAFDACFSPEKP